MKRLGLALLALAACGDDDATPSNTPDATTPLAIDATVGADPASGDPGRPDTMFGPKADAKLFVGEVEVGYVFYAALAPNEPTRAHVFARPDSNGSVNVSDYYISLVMDDEAWKVGSYDDAIGGRVRFTLADGRSYAGNAVDLDAGLTTLEVGVSDDGSHVYMRARLKLTVPSTQAGAAPLRVESTINTIL